MTMYKAFACAVEVVGAYLSPIGTRIYKSRTAINTTNPTTCPQGMPSLVKRAGHVTRGPVLRAGGTAVSGVRAAVITAAGSEVGANVVASVTTSSTADSRAAADASTARKSDTTEVTTANSTTNNTTADSTTTDGATRFLLGLVFDEVNLWLGWLSGSWGGNDDVRLLFGFLDKNVYKSLLFVLWLDGDDGRDRGRRGRSLNEDDLVVFLGRSDGWNTRSSVFNGFWWGNVDVDVFLD